MKKVWPLYLLLLYPTMAAAQDDTYSSKKRDRLFEQASYIFEGTPIGYQSYLGSDTTQIFTSILLEVHQVFRGNLKKGIVQIVFKGGQVGDKVQPFSHVFALNISNTYVVFGRRSDYPRAPKQFRIRTNNRLYLKVVTIEQESGIAYSNNPYGAFATGPYGLKHSSLKEVYAFLKTYPNIAIPTR